MLARIGRWIRQSTATGEEYTLGSTPDIEGERVAAVTLHAAFPALVLVGLFRGAASAGSGPLEGAMYGVLLWPALSPVAAGFGWLLSRRRPQLRFHAGQVFVTTLALTVLMHMWPISVVAVGLAPAAAGVAVGIYGVHALVAGHGFRVPFVGRVVGRKVSRSIPD